MDTIKLDLRAKVGKRSVSKHDLVSIRLPSSSSSNAIEKYNDYLGMVCLVCTTKKSLYRCPQCLIHYCSSDCFKKHDIDCNEQFSKDRIQSVFNLEANVKRNERNTSSGDDEDDDDELMMNRRNCSSVEHRERVDEILLKLENNDMNMDTLSVEDTDALHAAAGGYRSMRQLYQKGMLRWTPWWEQRHMHTSISISTASTDGDDDNDDCNIFVDTVAGQSYSIIQNVVKIDASSPLRYQIFGLVLGFVLTSRRMNGGYYSDRSLFLEYFWIDSPIMDTCYRPQSISEAMYQWMNKQHNEKYSRMQIKDILLDCSKILQSDHLISYCVLCCWMIASLDEEERDGCKVAQMLALYQKHFNKPISSSSSSKASIEHAMELLSRKAYYLLLHCLSRLNDHVFSVLYTEVLEYIDLFLSS